MGNFLENVLGQLEKAADGVVVREVRGQQFSSVTGRELLELVGRARASLRELGVERVQRYNHELAWSAGRELSRRLDMKLIAPEEMIGTMITLPLPSRFGSTVTDAAALRDALLFDHQIEVHVGVLNNQVCVRVSAQIYNEMADIHRLGDALCKLGL